MHPNEIVLTDYLDDALGAAERADVDRHLASCAECRALVDDLQRIARATATLDDREPPVRAWMRIERAIKLEREHTADAHARGARAFQPRGTGSRGLVARLPFGKPRASRGSRAMKGSRSIYIGLAAAAAVVLAAAVTLWLVPTRTRSTTQTAKTVTARPTAVATTSPSGAAAAQAIESELRAAEEHYEKAIKGLEQITTAEQNALDPQTAATVRKNLAVIDQAITESRAALRAEPTSEPAQQSLIESFKTKIALLQDTVALINEMRKGNEAAAGRIVSGLKQKGN